MGKEFVSSADTELLKSFRLFRDFKRSFTIWNIDYLLVMFKENADRK